MGKSQSQDGQADNDLAALRRERVAAHRRLSAWSFALEEHEANAPAAALAPHPFGDERRGVTAPGLVAA